MFLIIFIVNYYKQRRKIMFLFCLISIRYMFIQFYIPLENILEKKYNI
jgi:hypothetical protein